VDTRDRRNNGKDPYSAWHTCGTYTMEKSGNALAVSKSMGHTDLKSMESYRHQDLEPLRRAINQRNRRKKGWSGWENETYGAKRTGSREAAKQG
jgi:site-specific recombinase XerC